VGVAVVAACTILGLFAGALAPAAHAATVGTFQTLASSPEPVNNVVVDPTTNLIYAQGYEDTTWYSYNPATNVWTSLATAPLNQGNNGGAAYINGKIYTVYTGNSSQLGVYTIATDSWTTIPNPLGSGTGNITAVGGLLYLAEGTGAGSFVSYNPATTVTTTLANAPAFSGDCTDGFESWGGLAPYNGRIYGHQGNGCNGFAVYNIAANTWTELAKLPTDAVLGSAIDPITGTYYAYGDYSGSSDGSDHFYSFNIAAGTWAAPPTTFPFNDIDDGGMAYVSTPGLQGIYAVEGQENTGFVRYVTPLLANLALTKTASVSTPKVGATFTYTIKVANSGPSDATGTTITDPLPSQVSFVSDSASQGSCSGTTTVTCNLGTVKNGSSATVTITVKAKTAGTATNTATVSTLVTDTNSSKTATVGVSILANIKSLKLSVSPKKALAGQQVCFKFKAKSSGHGVSGVKVKFAKHSAKTSHSGKAQICVTLKKGTYKAKASKKGYSTAHATVTVRPAAAKKPPSFTG